MKKKLSYVITAVFCAVIVLALLWARDTFSQTSIITIYKDLCDAFFVPGVVSLGLGLLVFASNGGAFTMLKFGMIKLADLFRRDLTKVKYRTFYDYKEATKDNINDFWFLIIVGAAYILVAVVFLILYNTVAP